MKATYQTQQRKQLIDFLSENNEKQYTIEAIIEEMESQGEAPGKSSVYRLMKKLVEEGVVRRIAKDNSRHFVYQIIAGEACHSHLHMQCTQCGKLVHLSEQATKEADKLMHGVAGFDLDKEKTLLYGTCPDCIHRK